MYEANQASNPPRTLGPAVPDITPVSKSQEARCRVEELLDRLDESVGLLQSDLAMVLAPRPEEKVCNEACNPSIHPLHGWTCAVASRIEHILSSVCDIKSRVDL